MHTASYTSPAITGQPRIVIFQITIRQINFILAIGINWEILQNPCNSEIPLIIYPDYAIDGVLITEIFFSDAFGDYRCIGLSKNRIFISLYQRESYDVRKLSFRVCHVLLEFFITFL